MTSKGTLSGIALGLALFLGVGVGFAAELTITLRAERYLSLLAQRPGNEPLFDRFYEAWLDSSTPEGLERFLKEQLDSQPSPAKRLLLAFYYARQGRDAESLDLFSQAAEGDPLNGELLFLQAQAKLNTFDLEGAIADLERVRSLETPPDLADKSARLLGKLYLRFQMRTRTVSSSVRGGFFNCHRSRCFPPNGLAEEILTSRTPPTSSARPSSDSRNSHPKRCTTASEHAFER